MWYLPYLTLSVSLVPLYLCLSVSLFLCFSVSLVSRCLWCLCESVSLCLCVSVPLCLCVDVSNCLCASVSLYICVSMSSCPRGSLPPCFGVSGTLCLLVPAPLLRCFPVSLCLRVYASLRLCVPVYMCPCVSVSLCICVSVSPCLCVSLCFSVSAVSAVNINQKSTTAQINNNTCNPTSNGSIICDTTNDIVVQKDILNTNKRKNRTTVILGDSIINVIEQHKFKDGLGNDERVYVKYFSGADVEAMRSHVIPSKRFENDLVILHCVTNDLRGNNSAEEIATNIVNLTKEMKSEKNDVMVSGIIPCKDNLNEKGIDVNNFLITFCKDFNFNFIDNSNINKVTDQNKSGLHLNI